MSKITFRADEDLISRLEALDASKSEVMREALRGYLDNTERELTQSKPSDTEPTTIDDLVTDRLDQLVSEREPNRKQAVTSIPEITLNISLDGRAADGVSVDADREGSARKTSSPTDSHSQTQPTTTSCTQCGEDVDDEHVYCPNCGKKASHRLFCECGDEIQSDWGFCPSCGRRTPAADVLDNT